MQWWYPLNLCVSFLFVTVFICNTLSQEMHPFLLLFLQGEQRYVGGSFAFTNPVIISFLTS